MGHVCVRLFSCFSAAECMGRGKCFRHKACRSLKGLLKDWQCETLRGGGNWVMSISNNYFTKKAKVG